jgi:hypothetical protein
VGFLYKGRGAEKMGTVVLAIGVFAVLTFAACMALFSENFQ